MNNMKVAYIGLGSNKGKSKKYISKVVEVVANHDEFCIPQVSSFYKTSPMGDENQKDFTNAVMKVDTSYTPSQLLAFFLALEKAMGRARNPKNQNAARIIDCDILLYNRETIADKLLTIPHPRMTDRLFVMEPLAEVAPKAFIPDFGYAADVLNNFKSAGKYDGQRVEKLSD